MPHLLTLVEQFWHKVPGGTATATERTLAALLDRNEFTVTGLAARHRPPGRSTAAGRRVPGGCELVHFRLPRPLLYESWLRLERPSIDPLMGADSVFWASSMIVAPTDRPIVSTVHDLDFLVHPERSTRRGRSFFPQVWAKAKAESAHFVCPSRVVADQCLIRGVDPDRVSVVPWGVEPPRVDPGMVDEVLSHLVRRPDLVAAGVRLPAEFVLLVAPDQPRKNPATTAEALRRVGCPAVIVGSEPRGADGDLFASLGPSVVRVGQVAAHELSALYHSARALLFPSSAEGFGLPVLEAMAHGLPVVTSRGTATEEVAAGAAVLADPTDETEVADALAMVLADDDVRRIMIGQGLVRAAELTWDNTAKCYSEIFRAVL